MTAINHFQATEPVYWTIIMDHETPAAAVINNIVIAKPSIQQNKAAIIEPEAKIQPVNTPEPKPEPSVEPPSSVVIMNSELDFETVKRAGPPWALNLIMIFVVSAVIYLMRPLLPVLQ